MTAARPLRPGAVERFAYIDVVLEAAHGGPEADLDNKPNRLDETIHIILSFHTDLVHFSSSWSKLRAVYSLGGALERASAREVARLRRDGGLHRQKAKTIHRFLADVRKAAGEHSIGPLRAINDDEAERLLTRLPGLSWKAARCVPLYSLRRDVLPIDCKSFRILERTGVLSRRAVYRRRSLHDVIQTVIPGPRRRAMHVNMVVHGQRTCLPRITQFACCPLKADCPKVGLRVSAGRHVPTPIAISVGARAAIARAEARP